MEYQSWPFIARTLEKIQFWKWQFLSYVRHYYAHISCIWYLDIFSAVLQLFVLWSWPSVPSSLSLSPVSLGFNCKWCFLVSWSLLSWSNIILIAATRSAAQGGGGSFRRGNLQESLVVVDHGWQSESTDGLKGGWRCFLEWPHWLQWSPGGSPHPQLLDVL